MKLPFERTWWIEPGRILGGRYPGTHDAAESRAMLDALLAIGVRVIVNLQEPDELGRGGRPFPDYRPVIKELAAARGVTVRCLRFPIADLGVPSVATMSAIQAALREAVEASQLVYVHCWGGHGRTGTVAGCWLVGGAAGSGAAGLTPGKALALMKRRRAHDARLARDHAPQTAEQRKFIEDWGGAAHGFASRE